MSDLERGRGRKGAQLKTQLRGGACHLSEDHSAAVQNRGDEGEGTVVSLKTLEHLEL